MAGEAQNLERRCVQAVPAATAPVEGENDGGGGARVGGAVEGLLTFRASFTSKNKN